MTNTTSGDRATGALLGLALGDAMGAPTEFLTSCQITEQFGAWRYLHLPDPAEVTDDTQMTIAVGQALAAAGRRGMSARIFEEELRWRFIAWNRSEDNTRSPGLTCMASCRLLEDGRPFEDATQALSKGCGANMRVVPLGLDRSLDDVQRAGAAQLQAALTHGHPTALAASDLTAQAVHLLAAGVRPDCLPAALRAYAVAHRDRYLDSWLGDRLWRAGGYRTARQYIAAGWDEVLRSLEQLDRALDRGDIDEDPCLATGEGWIAEEALAGGLLCFLLLADQPASVLRRAAHTSGDSDSIATLAGAFAGAHLGPQAWRPQWAERVEYHEELLSLAATWDS
ncbi:ADP-ribosylglycohydrolase family protein [Streptacidiphilus sp. EB103A]|uniref:ADP-ribosylglycohydrolase family protein n=1 Tax=Streptacidiphilus sp. EB103A TaxID=3156275 RepID=UPI003511D492